MYSLHGVFDYGLSFSHGILCHPSVPIFFALGGHHVAIFSRAQNFPPNNFPMGKIRLALLWRAPRREMPFCLRCRYSSVITRRDRQKIILGMRADRSKNVHLSRRLHTGKISLLAWRKIFVVRSRICKVVVAEVEGLGVTNTRSDGLNGPTEFGK